MTRPNSLCAAWLPLLLARAAFGDPSPTPAPLAYTATVVNAMFGEPVTMTLYRDGQTAISERSGSSTRTYYDLTKGMSYSWDLSQPSAQCDSARFSGDWGDPFGTDLVGEMSKMHPKTTGAEVINGIKARVVEAVDPQGGGTLHFWIDAKYGELVKVVRPDPSGAAGTLYELKRLTVGKPEASKFPLPSQCSQLAAAPAVPSTAERIAALTGSAPGTYTTATTGPGSEDGCGVELSVVEGKTMKPITTGYRLAVDMSAAAANLETRPAYNIGLDIKDPKKPFFSGGGLHEVTDRLHNGTVVLGKPGKAFDMEMAFSDGGFGSGFIYRQCNGKTRAKLFYVLKNSGKSSDGGEWVWAR